MNKILFFLLFLSQKIMLKKNFFIDELNVADYAGRIATWIKDRVEAAYCTGVVIGMSGGIDCSVVARLCQLAKVDTHLIMMPYGDDMKNSGSRKHALELIDKFNFAYHVFDVKPAVDALVTSLDDSNLQQKTSTTLLSRSNVRPRVRMTYLYQYAQLTNRLVIGTGNLSERTVGYFTKWGDGACDFNPLALLTKKEVYTLALYLEIPACIIDKKPSADLWAGQTDEEELGLTYKQIDDYIIGNTSGNDEIDLKIEERIVKTAHKRAEIPVFG